MRVYKNVLYGMAGFFPLFLGMMMGTAQTVKGEPGTTAICRWKDNKAAVLTFFIDDDNAGEAPFIATTCADRGIKMTWNLITSPTYIQEDSAWGTWGGNWNLWRSIAAQGHDLGSHTITHACLSDITLAEAEVELRDSKAKIEQEVPAIGKCLVISYPGKAGGCPKDAAIRTLTSKYYITGCGDTGCWMGQCLPTSINLSTDPADEGFTIFNLYVNGSSTAEVDQLITAGGWISVYWHGLRNKWETDADFIAYMDHVYSKRTVLWTPSIKEVSQYLYERKASTVQLVSATASRMVLDLTHSLPTDVCDFDFPLTLKTEVATGWSTVTVRQGSDSSMVQAVEEAGVNYAYFDARPNQGQITLTIDTSPISRPAVSPCHGPAQVTFINPNPIKAAVLSRYLVDRQDLQVCDLKGKTTEGTSLLKPGVYLIIKTDRNRMQKVMVTR